MEKTTAFVTVAMICRVDAAAAATIYYNNKSLRALYCLQPNQIRNWSKHKTKKKKNIKKTDTHTRTYTHKHARIHFMHRFNRKIYININAVKLFYITFNGIVLQ